MTSPTREHGKVTGIATAGGPKLVEARDAAGVRLRQHFIDREISLDEFVMRLVKVRDARDIDGVNVAMRRLPAVTDRARDKRASRLAPTDVETVAHLFAVGDYGQRMPRGEWTAPEGIEPERWDALSTELQAALRRAAEAVRITRAAELDEEAARITRARACAVLHVTFGEPQAVRYKRYKITRSVYERALHAVSADLPVYQNKTLAGRAADKADAEYGRQRSVKETARAIRDAAIVALGDPERADRLRPTEIGRAIGMSKQLVDAVRQQGLAEAA